jgi:hypothetical protein
MSAGELKKMKIVGYTDISFQNKTGQEYEVMVNPENYSIKYETMVTTANQAQGSSLPILQYNQQSAQVLSFKFLFDGTGVIKKGNQAGVAVPGLPAKKPDVVQDLDNFKKAVYNFRGDKHQPPFVQLLWGPLLFNCLLTKMDITFKLFRPDGWPLRAEALCTFQSAIDIKKLEESKNKQSPDLTHTSIVKQGDTLPLLCFRQYGDSKYYYEVARFNGLTDIKSLVPGTKLLFPPIKTSQTDAS